MIAQVDNVGKSPALTSAVDVVFEVVDSKQAPSFEPGKRHPVSLMPIIFPGDSTKFPVAVSGIPAPARLTEAQISDLTLGKSYIALFGAALYKDQFGWHWTRFCAWKDYATQAASFLVSTCTGWNTLGGGEPKWDKPGTAPPE